MPVATIRPRNTRATSPNIVVILADDMGYETLGVNGSTSYRTPNLDALAAGGMRFTQAHATPLCTPSRVQLMTGKYNLSVGGSATAATTFTGPCSELVIKAW